MFKLSVLIGVYSYLIFFLGILGFLYKENIIFLTAMFFLTIAYIYQDSFKMNLFKCFKTFMSIHKLFSVLLLILFLQASVNLIGALGPELAFDALWYHLTLPKIYLINHSIHFISGNLLYYSAMPKLTEMLYAAALAMSNEIGAKIVHFSFGILTLIAIYKLSSKFFSQKVALFAVVIFYSNLVVAWQSITAYIDLTRTFFEVMALWGFINFLDTKKKRWLIGSAAMLGLAVSTKLLAIGSLLIFSALILLLFVSHSGKRRRSESRISYRDWRFRTSSSAVPSSLPKGQNDENGNVFSYLFTYWFICLLIPLPWFIFSFVNTGNPIYPFFTDIYKVNFDVALLNPFRFLFDTWNLLTHSSDPISLIYIMFLPLVIVFFKKFSLPMKLISLYSFLALIIWYFTPRTGGGRFILPYLPAFSIVVAGIVEKMGIYSSRERSESRSFKSLSIALVIFVSLISIVYRSAANAKYIPVIIGKESKTQFLTKNLNFSYGDFYDIDGYFESNIKQNDMILLYGFHNLYYVDFLFIDSSFVKKGDAFNYIAVQNSTIPKMFNDWTLIYLNPKTGVKLYSKGGKKWVY